jgi:Pyruvate/2-oxoacid:ferredoxin oxidoreductase gamma subunit
MARKKKKLQKPWQYQFSLGLVALTGVLVVGFFFQSAKIVREEEPLHIAIERIQTRNLESGGGN